MEKEGIVKFIESFFNNLKCEVKWENNYLIIDKVPKEFEKYYGKQCPYKLAFDKKEATEETELIDKGSLFLKAMTAFLENKGKTTLIKLDFTITPDDIKNSFKFKNCEIVGLEKRIENKFFIRFTFSTIFQYLNEKEQIFNHIFVAENKIIDFDLTKFKISEGKKSELEINDVKIFYDNAKEHLNGIINSKIKDVSENLNKKLDKEMKRIEEHYTNYLNEQKHELEKNENLLKNEDSEEKKKRYHEVIEKLNLNIEKIIKEKEFFIKDEQNKHSLNITNNLVNTSIIYYPVFHLNLWIKNAETLKQILLNFNPIENELSNILCEGCRIPLSEIYLCSSGHVTCPKCSNRCKECGKEYCLSCLDNACQACSRKVCKKCIQRCYKCSTKLCKSHSYKDSSNGKIACSKCVTRCSTCGEYFDDKFIKKCPSCSKTYCLKCVTKSVKNNLCLSCSKFCTVCSKYKSEKEFKRCISCKSEYCNFPGKCLECRKQLCNKLKY